MSKLPIFLSYSCSQLFKYSIFFRIELMINSVKKMLFSLPGFVVVQYIIEFLSSSSQFRFFNALCCRSGGFEVSVSVLHGQGLIVSYYRTRANVLRAERERRKCTSPVISFSGFVAQDIFHSEYFET